MGNQYFRFYDERNAEAVSVAGQLSIQWAEKTVNKYLNKTLGTENVDYIVASDTDSLYVRLDDLVSRVCLTDKEKIVNFLDKSCGRIPNCRLHFRKERPVHQFFTRTSSFSSVMARMLNS